MSNVHLAGKGAGNRVPYVVRALQVKVGEVIVVEVVELVVALDDNSFKQPSASPSRTSQADLEAENSRLKSTIANLRPAPPPSPFRPTPQPHVQQLNLKPLQTQHRRLHPLPPPYTLHARDRTSCRHRTICAKSQCR
jgi:hypothetical protein